MPTPLPDVPRRSALLTPRQTVRLFWLVTCVRALARAMERASARLDGAGSVPADDRLLRLTRRWLARNAEISALLRIPEPPQVRQVRAIFSVCPPSGPDEAARRTHIPAATAASRADVGEACKPAKLNASEQACSGSGSPRVRPSRDAE